VVEDEPEEEPPKIHATKKKVKKRKLDTLSSTTTVLSVHEDDYKENVFIEATYEGDRDAKTFQGNLKIEDTHEEENVFIETTYKGDRDAMTFKGNLKIEDTYEEDVLTFTFMKKDVQLVIANADTEDRDAKTPQGNFMIKDTYKYPIHEADHKEDVFVKDILARQFVEKRVLPMTDNAYREDMLTMSQQENVVLKDADKKYVQSAMDMITVEEDVDDEHYNLNNKTIIDNGQEDIKENNLMYKKGTEEDAEKLAVSAIASRRGEKGA
jgi:hypothetical protein